MPNKRADHKRKIQAWLDVELVEAFHALARQRGMQTTDLLEVLLEKQLRKELPGFLPDSFAASNGAGRSDFTSRVPEYREACTTHHEHIHQPATATQGV
jgi:adenylosuccinate lyase